ncbi:MAG: hypothetical protein OEO19_04265 [Gammaproteobacteria bacterium]|nr:hypothetical protein [Gammaproteobacteria bacterium]MDH3447116.1 hypothetical protein [Gammaproteobacteria bacterium]
MKSMVVVPESPSIELVSAIESAGRFAPGGPESELPLLLQATVRLTGITIANAWTHLDDDAKALRFCIPVIIVKTNPLGC